MVRTDLASRVFRYLDDILIFVALLLNLAVVISVDYFPYADVTNHLARYVLMARYWFGVPPEYIDVNLIPTGYIALDLLGVGLVHVFSPEAATRIMAVLAVLLLPMGAYTLFWRVYPEQRGWTLVAVLLSFNWYYLYGFLNYVIGIGLTLFWFAWWWPRRGSMSAVSLFALALSTAGLYLVHMAAAAIALVVVWLEYLLYILPVLTRARRAEVWSRLLSGRFLTAGVALISVGSLWFLGSIAHSITGLPSPFEFRSVESKVVHLFTPFYVFSDLQATVMIAGYVAALAIFSVAYYPRLRFNTLSLSAIVFFLLYLAFPVSMLNAYDVDVRFLLPAYVLLFFWPAESSRTSSRLPLIVPWLACVIHAGLIYSAAVTIDEELASFRQALRALPEKTTVLSLVSDHNRHGRVDPYRHFVLWHTVEARGRAAGLFSGGPSGPQLDHFIVTKPLYRLSDDWGTRLFEPLECSRVSRDYDYIIQAGRDERARALIEPCGRFTSRWGDIAIYKVVQR